MVQPVYTIHDLKTGKVRKISHTALQIAKKHGFDKHWEILPNAETLKSTPAPTPTPTVEIPTAKVEETVEFQEPQFEDPTTDEPVKKSKKKSKTDNQ